MTESFSQLQIAQDLAYIQEQDINSLRPLYNKVAGQLSAMRNSFLRKAEDSLTVKH